MDDVDPVPSISSGTVGSRFVTEAELGEAKANRDAAWKAAYARLGQEPPPQPVEDVYDGRSLFERLQAQKTAKQEEWDEKMKLSNQFRALDEEEVSFLHAVTDQSREEERNRKRRDDEEVQMFKSAVAQRGAIIPPTKPAPPTAPAPTTSKPTPAGKQPPAAKLAIPGKKGPKPLPVLKGVVIRKKDKGKAKASASASVKDKSVAKEGVGSGDSKEGDGLGTSVIMKKRSADDHDDRKGGGKQDGAKKAKVN